MPPSGTIVNRALKARFGCRVPRPLPPPSRPPPTRQSHRPRAHNGRKAEERAGTCPHAPSPPRRSSLSDLNRAGPWLTSEAAALALRAPETSSSPVTKVRLRGADENPCITSQLTWRRALRAQGAAASSTPRGTRILAEAGRFDTLGFSPAHQLQVDVLGSSGLLFTRGWPRPEEPALGPGLACLGWCSPRRSR